jgi:uncharacterized protein with PhoU and TrkA domain
MEERFEAKSVRELLTEMKDVSDLMVDLAYATVLFENRVLARLMYGLEDRMDELMYDIRAVAAVVTRDIKEAEKITGILQVASAAENISNATADIADLVLRKIEVHPVVSEAFSMADERIVMVEVEEDSAMIGKTFRELRLPSSIGVWTFGIRKRGAWTLSPKSDTRIEAGDVLLSKGPRDGVITFTKMAGKKFVAPSIGKKLGVLRKALTEMRDLSGIMVDMAYSSILFGSREIAEEVRESEEKFDKLSYRVWLEALKAAKQERDVRKLNSVLQLAKGMERISDAADSIADVVLREMELHPVFTAALSESQEHIGRINIPVDSSFVGKSLKDLELWDTMGAYVFMIKKKRRYLVDPPKRVRVNAGDVLFVRGTPFGVQRVREAAGVKP